MKLDVVVPTYNRSRLLQRTIESFFAAHRPEGLEVTVIVVDNNSKDDTAEVVRRLQVGAPIALRYVLETKQSSSHARNAGIEAADGDLIGFIDDDEEVDAEWFRVVYREFLDPATQFIGGPYLANCQVALPSWIPPGYNGVLGIIPGKPRALMTASFEGSLPGGNAVFRRAVFERVGPYNVKLGRGGKGLLSEEDAELYRRLLDAGLAGYHVPDLIIYHYIPEDRLTRRYFRRWCYWRGISQGVADKTRPQTVPYIAGLPRYRVRQALSGLLTLPRNLSNDRGNGPSFARELPLWDLFGFIRGKYFFSVDRYYSDQTK